jgi:Family of unknown function (DUF6476)
VIILMITMIVGVITVTGLLVTRMPDGSRQSVDWPEGLPLPEGAVAAAITRGSDWTGVVTTDGRMLIYNTDGSLRQEIKIAPAP